MALNMNEKDKAVEANGSQAAENKTVTPTEAEGEAEARIALLEAEKAKAIEEAANYKLAFLKQKNQAKNEDFDDETDEERIRRITREELSQTKIAQIDLEKEKLLKELAKENKELKLAQMNKTTTPPATMGSHNESTSVTDTLVTPEQVAAFKARGWSDKDIEKYKKNYARQIGR